MFSGQITSKELPGGVANELGISSSLRSHQKSSEPGKFVHPLQLSTKEASINSKEESFKLLRNLQGIHAPIKLQMEMNSVRKAVTRLPCLPSASFHLDILNGVDNLVTPEDVFGDRVNSEVMGDPHIMMEHKLGLKPL